MINLKYMRTVSISIQSITPHTYFNQFRNIGYFQRLKNLQVSIKDTAQSHQFHVYIAASDTNQKYNQSHQRWNLLNFQFRSMRAI